MTASGFLERFRNASWWVPPLNDRGEQPPSPENLARARQHARFWLQFDVVDDIEASEIPDLSIEDAQKLTEQIEQYRTITRNRDCTTEPTSDCVEQARTVFVAMRRILFEHLFDSDAVQMVEAIDRVRREGWFPDWVAAVEFQGGTDWSGDTAIWLWLIVEDSATEDNRILQELPGLQRRMERDLESAGIPGLVYLRFRSVSEEHEIRQGAVS